MTTTLAPRPARSSKPHPAAPAADPLERVFAFLRTHYLDYDCMENLHTVAGMDTVEFRRAFRARFGTTPALARAQLQVADMKALLMTGVPQTTLCERLGFSSHQRMSNAFRDVTGLSPTEWLRQQRKADPSIPEQPKRPGRRPGTPTPDATKERIRAGVTSSWIKRRSSPAIVKPRTPQSKGPQPVVTPAGRAAMEIMRGASAFDEHQRRMAAERDILPAGGFVAKVTRPSRERGEPAPINPQLIHVVDNTPTAATVFDRFARDPHRGAGKWWGED